MTMQYPITRTVEAHEHWAGLSFPDRYRWLENDSAEVSDWQREQSRIATEYVTSWPHHDDLKRSVDHFVETGARWTAPDLPTWAGGSWFRIENPEGAGGPRVVVAEEPFGPGRTIFEPVATTGDAPAFISWTSPSPDGHVLAVGLCDDGSERNRIILIDVVSAELLPNSPSQLLADTASGGAQWLPDSTGFFFSAMEDGPDGLSNIHQEVLCHRIGASTVREPVPWGDTSGFRAVSLSADGRYAVAVERLMIPIPIAIARIVAGESRSWKPFITDLDGMLLGHIMGDSYIAVTDIGASRGRVVAVPLDATDPSDPAFWTDVVAESDAVIRGITPVGEQLVLTELVHTYGRVRVINVDGSVAREVPLPGRGAVAQAAIQFSSAPSEGGSKQVLFSFSSLTQSTGVYRFRLDHDDLETLIEPKARLENVEVIDQEVASSDGTLIPFRIVRRTDVPRQGPQPTLIYAYGGFNLAFVPAYAGEFAAFVEAGGVLVHANLRGGGELGVDWWHAGRLEFKQNGYDDLYAIATRLIDSGSATPQTLGVAGASNGGLMAGVALTQRPALWAVVVPRVPILDLLGGCRDPYGRTGITLEYGDPEIAENVQRLASYSPYHNVRPGTPYPAVFFDVGGSDPRCPAWHGRKLAASLQAASNSGKPVLIHVRDGAGHGAANSRETTVEGVTEWLGFVMMQLGMPPSVS